MRAKVDGDRTAVLTAMWEGINAARYAVARENLDPISEAQVCAEAALASLESVGFKVVRNA